MLENWNNNTIAGRMRLWGFCKPHPELILKNPEVWTVLLALMNKMSVPFSKA
jgi:hypothetical protein